MVPNGLVQFSQRLKALDTLHLTHVQVDVKDILQEYGYVQIIPLVYAHTGCFQRSLRLDHSCVPVLAVVDDGVPVVAGDLLGSQDIGR